MKRAIYLLILLLPTFSSAFDLDIEARGAWLIPKSGTMRKTYGKGFPEYALELGIPLNQCLTVFSNVSYYEKEGHSPLSHRTSVENWALTFGGKYYFKPYCLYRPYIGLGGGGAHIKFFDRSPFVKGHIDRFGLSFIAKIGTEICFSRYLYVDLFADYSGYFYSFKSRSGTGGHRLNAGGAKAGAALGIRF